MGSFFKDTTSFLTEGIWRIKLSELPSGKSFIMRYLKVIVLAVKGFWEDRCELWASALTFYSTLSVVPVVAMLFGVAKGFGYEQKLKNQLYERFAGQEEVLNKIVEFADSFLENTKGGLIAGIGIVVLFWTIVNIFGNIESSFNAIWGFHKNRTLLRKFTDYLSLMLICPVLFIASSSATVFIAAKITGITSQAALTQPFNPLIISMVRLLPIIVIWILFTFIYFFMPNGKINFRSALLGGIIAGSLYQGLQEFYVFIQVALSKYNAIYGSFSALPLFLIWLRLSWLIVLFGAEISFADQNVENTEFEPDCRKVSLTYKKLLALWITRFTVFRFCAEELPPKDSEITEKLGIPVKLLREIVSKLVHSGVLAERNIENTDLTGYCPAVSTDKITIKYVIDAMESDSVEQLPVKKDEVYEKLLENMKILAENIEKSPANVLLKNL